MTPTESGPWREISGSLVFRSKLRPPNADRLVLRQRLLDLLDAWKPLTLVVSPAGTGKSSLLASWVATLNTPVAWLSVDDTDNDAVQFWTGVIAALEMMLERDLRRPMSLLQRPGSLDIAVAALLADLESFPQPPSVLLIDDVQLVDHNPESVASLAVFVQHLPRWLHVVLVGRRAPRLPLARMRARGESVRSATPISCSPAAEAEELLTALAPSLDQSSHQRVVERAGGWAAGIGLAALTRARPVSRRHRRTTARRC